MAKLALSVGIGIVGGLLAIATAGVATPAIFGLGFSIGSVIGGIAGSVLFPPAGVVGPRLNDLQISSSAPGNPIAFGYGTYRFGGQIIWAQLIQEHKTKKSAKGGPTITSYSYTCTFAASFGEGPGQIIQLWGDQNVFYDITGTTKIAASDAFVPTLYEGSETQLPDPTIVAIAGADVTPGYRGQIYAVFTNFPLEQYGNRIPNLRGTVSFGSNDPNFSKLTVDLGTVMPAQGIIMDLPNSLVYLPSTFIAQNMSKVSLDTNSLLRTNVPIGQNLVLPADLFYNFAPGTTALGRIACVDGEGYLWGFCEGDAGTNFIHKVDPNSFSVVAFTPLTTLGSAFDIACYPNGTGAIVATVSGVSNRGMIMIRASDCTFQGLYTFAPPNGSALGINDLRFTQDYPVFDSTGHAYFIAVSHISDDWFLYKVDLSSAGGINGIFANVEIFSYVGDSNVGIGNFVIINPQNDTAIVYTSTGCISVIDTSDGAVIQSVNAPVYDGAVTYHSGDIVSLNGQNYIATATTTNNAPPNASFWNTTSTASPAVLVSNAVFGPQPAAHAQLGQTHNGTLLASSLDGGQLRVLRVSDFSVERTYTVPTDWISSGFLSPSILDWKYNWIDNSILLAWANATASHYFFYRLFLGRLGNDGVPISDIVTNLCERADITAGELDTTALEDISCMGYAIFNPQSAQSCLSPLCQAFQFDIIESDFKLKGVPRGGVSALTIPDQDLGLDTDNKQLTETLNAYQDVPKDIQITYVDPALDYQQGKQQRIRHAKTKKGINQTIINLPFVMSPTDAMQLADKFMWLSELERTTYDTNLWKAFYMLLDPSDIVQFNYEGMTFEMRIAKNSVGKNFAIEVAGVSENASLYLSGLTGAGQDGFNKSHVNAFGPTILFMLDTPLLQDSDTSPTGSSGIYFAGASPVSNFPGYVLYMSSDNQTFDDQATESDQVSYGQCSNTLAAPVSPWVWDHVNTLTVFMASGVPTSTSELNVYNGANGVVVGSEVIQFKTATLNGDGSYTLSNLLRGRRGTEWACGTHVTGERAFFPNINGGLHRLVMNASLVGLLRYLKAITLGNDTNSQAAQSLTLQGNDLKPYAPTGIAGSRDGSNNLTLTWVRRTRIGGSFGIAGVAPLSEESEAYSIDIIVSGIVKRTITASTPTASYSAAQQTADGITPGNPVTLKVYQISAVVGRGFAGPASV